MWEGCGCETAFRVEEDAVFMSAILNMVTVGMNKASSNQKVSI